MSYPRRHKRACLLTLALSVCFLFSGCAYIRLLHLKNQLKNFEQYVTVEKSDGLAFVFKKPVLKSKDFVFLTDSQPTRIIPHAEDASVSTWIWRFEKDLSRSSSKKDSCSIVFATTFRNGLLERMEIDESLLKAMDADFIVAMLESLGKAKINKLKMAIRSEVKRDDAPDTRFPSIAVIKKVFGKPTSVREPNEEVENEYVFNFRNPESQTIAGQFKVVFQSKSKLDSSISGFVLSGKGR